MAFQKKEWNSGDTLSHVELNRIEEGILQNSQIEIPDMKDVVKFTEFSAGVDPAKRKTIVLENFDTISSKDTKGQGHNLLMLSKWDKVDVGAPGVIMNLNTKDRIQVNDEDSVALKSELDAVSEKVTTAEGKLTDLTNTVTSLSSKDTEIEQSLNEYKSEKIKIGDIVWGEGLIGYFPNDTTGATYEIPNSEDGLKHIVCDEVHIWDQYYKLVLDRVTDEETHEEKMVVGKKSTHTHHDVRGKFELVCTYNKNIQFTLDKMDDGRVKIKCFNFWRKIG